MQRTARNRIVAQATKSAGHGNHLSELNVYSPVRMRMLDWIGLGLAGPLAMSALLIHFLPEEPQE